jgi:hypothetical protein
MAQERLLMKPKSMTPARGRLRKLLGELPLLPGEDRATFEELSDLVYEAVKPANIIDEMLVDEVVCLEWDILRWRRLKWSLIRARGFDALVSFLPDQLHYDSYSETFAEDLADILRDNVSAEHAELAPTIVQNYIRDEKGRGRHSRQNSLQSRTEHGHDSE